MWICTILLWWYACGIRFSGIRDVLLVYPCLTFLSKPCLTLDMRPSRFLSESGLTGPKFNLTPICMYEWLCNNNHKIKQQKNNFQKLILKHVPLRTTISPIYGYILIPLNYSTQIIYIIKLNNYIFLKIINNIVKLCYYSITRNNSTNILETSQQS